MKNLRQRIKQLIKEQESMCYACIDGNVDSQPYPGNAWSVPNGFYGVSPTWYGQEICMMGGGIGPTNGTYYFTDQTFVTSECNSGSTITSTLSNTSPCPDGMMNNISGNNMSYLCSPGNEQNWYDAFTPYYGTAEGWEDSWTGQYQNYCCSPNTATTTTFSGETTGCGGFANIPQDFQDTICDSCEDPNYINMHCECCPGGSGVASINPEDIGTTIEPQGMTPMAKKRPVKMKNKK